MKLIESIDEVKNNINESVMGITRCYILIKYANNTEEEQELYESELRKRYINFYRNMLVFEERINESYDGSMRELFKKISDFDFYKSKMGFLNSMDVGEIEEIDPSVDEDYEVKASMSQVKLNFYQNNKFEFGINTRFHVDTSKYSTINIEAKDNEEKESVFRALTLCFKGKYCSKNRNKLVLKDMQ